MSMLEMVIADSLVPADFAPDLLRDMVLPGLDMLAAQGTARECRAPHADLLPAWLAWPMRESVQVDVALGWSRHAGLPDKAPDAERYLIEPVHLDVGNHGLILGDPASLDISLDEAMQLVSAIQALDPTLQIHVADAKHWLLETDASFNLKGSVPEAALGHDILPWLPHGEARQRWSRLANEIQMVWHDHVVNQAREERGAPPINAVWLSGDAAGRDATPLPYRRTLGAPAWLSAWPTTPEASATLTLVTGLSQATREEDWSAYRNLLTGIDQHVVDAIAELRSGSIQQLEVAFTGDGWIRACQLRRSDLYKFWRRGKAIELIDCPQ